MALTISWDVACVALFCRHVMASQWSSSAQHTQNDMARQSRSRLPCIPVDCFCISVTTISVWSTVRKTFRKFSDTQDFEFHFLISLCVMTSSLIHNSLVIHAHILISSHRDSFLSHASDFLLHPDVHHWWCAQDFFYPRDESAFVDSKDVASMQRIFTMTRFSIQNSVRCEK